MFPPDMVIGSAAMNLDPELIIDFKKLKLGRHISKGPIR